MTDEVKLTGRIDRHYTGGPPLYSELTDVYRLEGLSRHGDPFVHETHVRAEAEYIGTRVVRRGGTLELWRCVYDSPAATWKKRERLEIPT